MATAYCIYFSPQSVKIIKASPVGTERTHTVQDFWIAIITLHLAGIVLVEMLGQKWLLHVFLQATAGPMLLAG